MNMSIKHVLVPQTRYQALLSIEEKYFSQTKQQQQQRLESADSELKEDQQRGSSDSELKGQEEENIEDQQQKQDSVKEESEVADDLIGEGATKTNLEEEELPLLRPPGIPARTGTGTTRTLKKWLVWH